MNATLSPAAVTAIDKITKLLALAGNNPNEAEAAVATAKAMELMATYNLDMITLGQGNAPTDNTRKDEYLSGGLYGWQRDLWNAVCELNFCKYWFVRGLAKGSKYEHRVLGSQANVASAKVMAEYLQQTIERLAQRWAKEQGYKSCFVREAIAYREGMAMRIGGKLWDMRNESFREERKRAAEAAQRRESTGGNAHRRDVHHGDGNSTALVLSDVVNTEADLNDDYLEGVPPGTNARRRKEWEAKIEASKAARIEAERLQDEAEETNPALKAERLAREAKAEAEFQKRLDKERNRKERPRAKTAAEKRQDLNGYWIGYEAGKNVGLDTQVDKAASRRALA